MSLSSPKIKTCQDLDINELFPVKIPFQISFRSEAYTFRKNFGTDIWILKAGELFATFLQKTSENAGFIPDKKIIIDQFNIVRFERGNRNWSNHHITIQFNYSLLDQNEKTLLMGKIESEGASNIKLLELLNLFTLNSTHMDKTISMALHRAIENALKTLNKKITPFLNK